MHTACFTMVAREIFKKVNSDLPVYQVIVTMFISDMFMKVNNVLYHVSITIGYKEMFMKVKNIIYHVSDTMIIREIFEKVNYVLISK